MCPPTPAPIWLPDLMVIVPTPCSCGGRDSYVVAEGQAGGNSASWEEAIGPRKPVYYSRDRGQLPHRKGKEGSQCKMMAETQGVTIHQALHRTCHKH